MLQSGMLSRSAVVAALAISSHSAVGIARLPSDLLALAPHESRPPLGAPQMPPVFPRLAPAAAPAQPSARPPAHVGPQPGLLPVRMLGAPGGRARGAFKLKNILFY